MIAPRDNTTERLPSSERQLDVLAITNLFPSAREPERATFNRQQICALAESCKVRVVAPLPYLRHSLKSVPVEEVVAGLQVFHPRYAVVPGLFRSTHGATLYAGLRPTVARLQRESDFDVIFASWAYPDAYAAARLARRLNKPLVVKLHGTDVHLGMQLSWRRRKIAFALATAQRSITVSESLERCVVELGADPARVHVLRNAVDGRRFHRRDRQSCREALGLASDRRHLLFVGNLVGVKGVEHLVRALAATGEPTCLQIVGDGPERQKLEQLATSLHLEDRIRFHGRCPHDEIPIWLNAADVLCLPSLHEGCPNVVLEALACGIPVVASDVGGLPELIETEHHGQLVPPADSAALASAIQTVLASRRDMPEDAVAVTGWQENAARVHALLQRAVDEHRASERTI